MRNHIRRTGQSNSKDRRSSNKAEGNSSRQRSQNQENPKDLYKRYLLKAKEASTAGDHIGAEQFYQQAEHYYRIFSHNNPSPAPVEIKNKAL